MPFDVDIDHEHGRVHSRWWGAVDRAALFAYVDVVWRDPRARAYDELVDFRLVEFVDLPSAAIADLVRYSRQLDNPERSARSAVIAASALVYGLSRMFAGQRAADSDDRREFRVFDDAAAALAWLAGGD
ncbi:MAG: hypothetical protein AB7Q81_19050 [Gammaproteobacteria bacterium]